MGYYTSYSLEINDESEREAIVCELRAKEVIDYALTSSLGTNDDVKWYSCSEDMKDVSEKFPDVLFTLSGEGEEHGDLWKEYFLAGQSHCVKVTLSFPEFDHSKLK